MQITLFLLFGFFLSILFGMVIIPRILVISHKKRLYDVPDFRKVHTTPVPRLGGLSFFPVILMSMFLVIGFRLYTWSEDLSSLSFNMLYEYLFLFVGMTLLYLVGVCDDLVGVGYRYKFAVQIVAFRRNIVDEGFYYDETFNRAEDIEYWLRLRNNGFRIMNMKDTLLNYRVIGDLAAKRDKIHFKYNYLARKKNFSKRYVVLDGVSLLVAQLYACMSEKMRTFIYAKENKKSI